MVRLLYFIFFAFIFSCTIIEDSDITSQEELDNLRFVSIEIKQDTNTGSSTAVAKVTTDSVVDILLTTPSFTGTLTRTLWMDWPALGSSSKLKLKSGVTTTFKSYASFLESGKPWTFYLFDNDSTVSDQVRFRYDVNERLNRIISIPYLDYLDTLRDELIYDASGNLTSIERKCNSNPSKAGTFTFGGQNNNVGFTFQGMRYENACQGDGCGSNWGGNYHVLGADNFPTGVMNLTTFQREYLSMQDFNSINQSNCGSTGCDAWIDTFYFHPLMLLKDQLEIGDDLLFIYMVDWWQPVSAQESTNNEKVTFSFDYDL